MKKVLLVAGAFGVVLFGIVIVSQPRAEDASQSTDLTQLPSQEVTGVRALNIPHPIPEDSLEAIGDRYSLGPNGEILLDGKPLQIDQKK